VPSPDATLIAVPQLFGLYLSEALPQAAVSSIVIAPNSGRTSVAWLRDRRGLVWAPLNDDWVRTIEIIELDDGVARWQGAGESGALGQDYLWASW